MTKRFQGTIHLKLNKRHVIKLLDALIRIYPQCYKEHKRDINTHEEYIKVTGVSSWFNVTFEKGIKAFKYSNFNKEAFDEKFETLNYMLKLLSGQKLEASVLKALKQLLVMNPTKEGEITIILKDNKPITVKDIGYNDLISWLNREDY